MYDQFGFYSENGMPGGRAAASGRRAEHGFRRIRFLRVSPKRGRRRAAGRRDRRRSPAASAICSASSSDAAAARKQPARRRRAPISSTRSNIDFWQAIRGTQVRLNITRQEVCDTCKGSGLGRRRQSRLSASATAPAMSRQMAGAMRFNLTCPRCEGTRQAAQCLPDLPRRWTGRSNRTRWRFAFPPGVTTARVCACRVRATPARMGAPAGRSLHHHPGGAASVLRARRRRHRDQGSDDRCGSRSGREDRSSDHRWPRAAEDSAGHPERTEVPAARKGRSECAQRTRAAIRSSK